MKKLNVEYKNNIYKLYYANKLIASHSEESRVLLWDNAKAKKLHLNRVFDVQYLIAKVLTRKS